MVLTHYTDERNLDAIRESGILKCALSLMTLDEAKELACIPRPQCKPISCGAILRDQQPLLCREIPPTPEEVKRLNEYVFFWADPIGEKENFSRKMFYRKYKRLKRFHLRLRCSLGDLRSVNPGIDILYAPCNLGAKDGGGQYRLLHPNKEKMAVEVVVRGEVRLPDKVEWDCE